MADFFNALEQKHIDFITAQQMFFVATAPKDGRLNLSPKGLDCFRIISPTEVAYLDYVGSGNETAAHLLDDGRITVMFNSYTRNALILRIYGRGTAHAPGSARFAQLMTHYKDSPGIRQIFTIQIDNLQTSCGYGVPVFELVEERKTLTKWAEKKGPQGVKDYFEERNRVSIDGLPAVE
ncbi:MAG: pyridoxamine 5'-phosphate oxidase [Alphaproteobacteria bacterium]|nr:MAG: pyridoxamine 5'-phosphate oxidase [Alphaproteobacteria bacterium]